MSVPDAGDLPIDAVPCRVDRCPLLALVADEAKGPPRRCVFHASGKLNALDVRHSATLTANEVLRGLLRRRRAAADAFLLRKRHGDFRVSASTLGGVVFIVVFAGPLVASARVDRTVDPERVLAGLLRKQVLAASDEAP